MIYGVVQKSKSTYSRSLSLQYRSLHCKLLNYQFIRRNRLFFSWIFSVVHKKKFKFTRFTSGFTKKRKKLGKGVFVQKRVAPRVNLRMQALQARLLKHGNKVRARKLVEDLIIILAEDSKLRSGIKAINTALLKLEPPYEVISRRRGREVFVYPVPIWPSRRLFLATRLLMAGVKQCREATGYSLLGALFAEVRAICLNPVESCAYKLYGRLLEVGIENMHVSRRFVRRARF